MSTCKYLHFLSKYDIVHPIKKGCFIMGTWADKERNWKTNTSEAMVNLNRFFHELKIGIDFTTLDGKKFSYREGQRELAMAIMRAIKDRKILIAEAGVGIGKSFGYLLPIFQSFKSLKEDFNRVIISTSSIGLQEQLIKDIETFLNTHGMNIKVEVSKGINNYICIKKLTSALNNANLHHDTKDLLVLEKIKGEIIQHNTSDIADMPEISPSLKKRLQVSGGCPNCEEKKKCPFYLKEESIAEANIVVTNHVHLPNLLNKKIKPDLVVIDEAHNLEELVRLSTSKTINIKEVIDTLTYTLNALQFSQRDMHYEVEAFMPIKQAVIGDLTKLAVALRNNAKAIFKRENNGRVNIQEVDRAMINLHSVPVRNCLERLICDLGPIKNVFTSTRYSRDIERAHRLMLEYLKVFIDMYKDDKSENIYWVNFISADHIEIEYSQKDLSSFYNQLFSSPTILTSGTLATQKNYDHVMLSWGIKDREDVITYPPIQTPFNHKKNSLFYYDKTAPHPAETEFFEYVSETASRVNDLINLTDGKSLVLFTSKSTMNAVYKIVKMANPSRNIILQGDKDVSRCKEEFANDIDSCLFATGAFWEGIDLKGRTLSNLIIVKLPFPVEDPIVNYKKTTLDKAQADKLAMNVMLMKLAQGCGRLIRSVDDTGVVCCLDPRAEVYLPIIKSTLPFVNYTDDPDKLAEFVNLKINNQVTYSKKHSLKPVKDEKTSQ